MTTMQRSEQQNEAAEAEAARLLESNTEMLHRYEERTEAIPRCSYCAAPRIGRAFDEECPALLRAALRREREERERAVADRDHEWWQALALNDAVAPTPEAVKAYVLSERELATDETAEEPPCDCNCLFCEEGRHCKSRTYDGTTGAWEGCLYDKEHDPPRAPLTRRA